jgi:hypothetical protein
VHFILFHLLHISTVHIYIVQPLLFYSKTNHFLSKPFLHPCFDPQTNIPLSFFLNHIYNTTSILEEWEAWEEWKDWEEWTSFYVKFSVDLMFCYCYICCNYLIIYVYCRDLMGWVVMQWMILMRVTMKPEGIYACTFSFSYYIF